MSGHNTQLQFNQPIHLHLSMTLPSFRPSHRYLICLGVTYWIQTCIDAFGLTTEVDEARYRHIGRAFQ